MVPPKVTDSHDKTKANQDEVGCIGSIARIVLMLGVFIAAFGLATHEWGWEVAGNGLAGFLCVAIAGGMVFLILTGKGGGSRTGSSSSGGCGSSCGGGGGCGGGCGG